MHLNVQSMRAPRRLNALEERLLRDKVDVCALQETWLRAGEEDPHVEGFHWVGRNRPGSAYGGVTFLVRVGVPFSTVMCNEDHFHRAALELCEITVKSTLGDIRLINVYCPLTRTPLRGSPL